MPSIVAYNQSASWFPRARRGAASGTSYFDGMAMDHHMFDNVFVDPDALRAFRATGMWPDGTVFAKESRGGQTKGSINKTGEFQREPVEGLELHVKDSVRFKGGWAFFEFGSNDPARQIPTKASCYACHQTHAAVDTTFVQFYPTLIGIARAKKTFSASYLSEIRASTDSGAGKL